MTGSLTSLLTRKVLIFQCFWASSSIISAWYFQHSTSRFALACYGWEFLFLGANIDAVETAKHFGIGQDRAVSYRSDSVGTQLNYEVISDAVACVRSKANLPIGWKSRIEEDMRRRG